VVVVGVAWGVKGRERRRYCYNNNNNNIASVAAAAGSTTTTLPTTTRPVMCPNPEDQVIYNYFASDYFTMMYPVHGYDLLDGSGQMLALPKDMPQAIVLWRDSPVGFLEVRFRVRHASSVTLTLTYESQDTFTISHPATRDPVSCRYIR